LKEDDGKAKPVKSMKNLIHKGYVLAVIVHSLRQVYFGKIYRQSTSTANRAKYQLN
jgi:hypothetical protein